MKMRKITAMALATVMAVGTMATTAMATEDWKSFKIDPSQIPQEKLDTTLSVAVSARNTKLRFWIPADPTMKRSII